MARNVMDSKNASRVKYDINRSFQRWATSMNDEKSGALSNGAMWNMTHKPYSSNIVLK